MKGCIIVNSYVTKRNELNQAYRLAEEFAKSNVQADILPTSKFCVFVNGDKLRENVDYDFYIFFDKDKHILQALDKTNTKIFNNAKAIELCDDKLMTHIALANNDIPMPKTLGGLLCYYPHADYDSNLLDQAVDKLGYPIVVKECHGSFGKNVYLAHDRAELEKIAEKVKLKPHLFQQFIAESSGKDIRVIVIGGKVIGGMMRENPSDFRSNIEIGGVGKPYTLNELQIKLCEKVANILNLDYCGIDLLQDEKGQPLVCEVNSNAFFGTFEMVTKLNVAKMYADYIIDKVNSN